jgi:VanZ family protein
MIGGLYTAVWIGLCRNAVEGIHLAQYGLMAVLVLRSLRDRVSLPIAYGGGVLLTLVVSWGNELVQSVLPNRVYDPRDVVLDGISAVLAMMLVWQVEQ